MEVFRIETERLLITQFDESMIESVHLNSLDEDNRTFLPDEVFETIEEAQDTVHFLMQCYSGNSGPFVYPILLKNKENIGYIQAIPLDNGNWEIGYHIGKSHTRNGYATEAVKAFIPKIMKQLNISSILGLCRVDNIASCNVLENCSFILQDKKIQDYHGEQHEVCKYIYSL